MEASTGLLHVVIAITANPRPESAGLESGSVIKVQALVGVAFDHLPYPFHSRPPPSSTFIHTALLTPPGPSHATDITCEDVPVLHRQLTPPAASQPLWPQARQPFRLWRLFLPFTRSRPAGSDSIRPAGSISSTTTARTTASIVEDPTGVARSSLTPEDVRSMEGGVGSN